MVQVVHIVTAVTGVLGYAVLVTLVILKWNLSGKFKRAFCPPAPVSRKHEIQGPHNDRVYRSRLLLQQLLQLDVHLLCLRAARSPVSSRRDLCLQDLCKHQAGQPLVSPLLSSPS